jgi:hypothetical protein
MHGLNLPRFYGEIHNFHHYQAISICHTHIPHLAFPVSRIGQFVSPSSPPDILSSTSFSRDDSCAVRRFWRSTGSGFGRRSLSLLPPSLAFWCTASSPGRMCAALFRLSRQGRLLSAVSRQCLAAALCCLPSCARPRDGCARDPCAGGRGQVRRLARAVRPPGGQRLLAPARALQLREWTVTRLRRARGSGAGAGLRAHFWARPWPAPPLGPEPGWGESGPSSENSRSEAGGPLVLPGIRGSRNGAYARLRAGERPATASWA